MNNYEFCTHWAIGQQGRVPMRALDYGCGAGQIVSMLRARGVNASGCDVFYEGGDYSRMVEPGLLDTVIRRMEPDGMIPFPDSSFDVVVNNQVLEHVEDLDRALSEIARVLKPGGRVLSLFPDRGVWREGHCGIPFVHWFPRRSRLRVYYAALWRAVGFGNFKNGKSVMQWSEDFCDWLDKWTFYRSNAEIDRAFRRWIGVPAGIEANWLACRLGERKALAALIPATVRRFMVNKLAGRVFECTMTSA